MCIYSHLHVKVHNFRIIVVFIKRMLQVVDNESFWLKVVLKHEKDLILTTRYAFLFWSRDIPSKFVVGTLIYALYSVTRDI